MSAEREQEAIELLDLVAQGLWNRYRLELPGQGVGMEPPWGDYESGQTAAFYRAARAIIEEAS